MSLNLRDGAGRLGKESVQFCPELEQWKENMRGFVPISVKVLMTCGSEGTSSVVSTHSTQQKYISVNIYSCKGEWTIIKKRKL